MSRLDQLAAHTVLTERTAERDRARDVAVQLEQECHRVEAERDDALALAARLLGRCDRMIGVVDAAVDGEYATKGRDFGRGVAHLARLVLEATLDGTS